MNTMGFKRSVNAAAILLVLAFSLAGASSQHPRKFDEFGDINCEDEMARLDNFAIQLQNEPATRGIMIFYGGRRFRGRLPKQGEAAARAARIKPYLVERRGVSSERVIVIDGGYREEFQVDLWVIPAGVTPPEPNSTISARDIKFQKGKANSRQFRCQI
jgi:hypothetical protein